MLYAFLNFAIYLVILYKVMLEIASILRYNYIKFYGGVQLRIFLVDDDKIIRLGIRKVIEKSDLNCTIIGETSDGELALQELQSIEDIDLIITDIRMPVMDGLELIREIRKFNTVVRIIVLSGFDDFKYVRNAFMDGAVDYVLKPINKEEFLNLLKKLKSDIENDNKEKGQLVEYHNLYMEKTINKLLHNKYKKLEDIEEKVAQIGIKTEGSFAVMILQADNSYKVLKKQVTYESTLENAFIKLTNLFRLDTNYKFYSYVSYDSIVILVEGDKSPVGKEVFNKYHLYIKNTPLNDKLTFTLGVSNIFNHISDASTAYEEAKKASDARFYFGKNTFITYEQVEKNYLEPTINSGELIRDLAMAYELCDYMKVKDELERIFNCMHGIEPTEYRNRIKMIIERLLFQMKDFQEAVQLCDFDYEYFIQYVNTEDELKIHLLITSQSIIEYMKRERDKRSKKRIEMAKKFVELHYSEPITLNQVADYVELNASYFSSLFKKETGKNFSDYLLNCRINIAKNLLLDPTIKVYEIGNKVGYEDVVSFGRAFKKKIGMSPKEYRNIIS